MTGPEYAQPDMLRGSKAIALFVYGDEKQAKRVFNLFYRVRYPHRFPIYKLGGELVARRSEITAWFEEQRLKGADNDNSPSNDHAA